MQDSNDPFTINLKNPSSESRNLKCNGLDGLELFTEEETHESIDKWTSDIKNNLALALRNLKLGKFNSAYISQNQPSISDRIGTVFEKIGDTIRIPTKEAVGGVIVGTGIKMALNAVAQATGAGLVVAGLAASYGFGKTWQETYKEQKNNGENRTNAAKNMFKGTLTQEFAKRALRNSFGVGASMAVGVNYEEIIDAGQSFKDHFSPYITPYIDNIKEAAAPAIESVKTSWKSFLSLGKEKMADISSSISGTLKHYSIKNFSTPDNLSGLKTNGTDQPTTVSTAIVVEQSAIQTSSLSTKIEPSITPDSGSINPVSSNPIKQYLEEEGSILALSAQNGNAQALKDMGVQCLHDGEKKPSFCATLFEKAANLGNLQAMSDIPYLESRDFLPEKSLESIVSSIDISTLSEQAQEIVEQAGRGKEWALNDLAVGMMNKWDGFPSDKFMNGVRIIHELAEAGHPKSIRDLSELIEHKLIPAQYAL